MKSKDMRNIYYYYDPLVQADESNNRFAVDYYKTNGKQKVWAGRIYESTSASALYRIRNLVNSLNKPRPLFGWNGRIVQWFYWRKDIRNQKKS